MTPRIRNVLALASLTLMVSLPLAAFAASSGSGFFRMGGNKQTYKHAVALSRDSGEAGQRKVNVYLTTHPVDPKHGANGFDLDDGITEQLREVGGGMTRITINPDGKDGGMWFWVSEPSDTFNTSGFGKLTLTTNTPTRLEGSHVLAEPEDFFDKTYEFDLKFAVDLTDANFTGDPLPAGGGEPGKAWLAYQKAIIDGDVDAVRAQMGQMGEWMLPKDDPESSKSYLESMQSDAVRGAKISGGWLQGERAILKVDGKDGDGNTRRGMVLLQRDGEQWKEESKDMNTIWK